MQGTLKGLDHQTTIVLADCKERIFGEGEGCEEVALGLYVVRGDQICCIGASRCSAARAAGVRLQGGAAGAAL